MPKKLFEQLEKSVINSLDRYRTDLFFRTTIHIIVLQIVLTLVIVTGLWFVTDYLVATTSETLMATFEQMLQGQEVTSNSMSELLEEVQLGQFWPVVLMVITVILSFGFIMVYIALTPTRRSLERKKRFISNISHELRTPLAILRTNTDVALLDSNLPPKVQEMLKRNLVEFGRISDIMSNLLTLSKLMQDKHVQFENVDLAVIAQQAIDMITANNEDIALTTKVLTKHQVIGNARALEQVVFNLIKNAVAHIQKNGVITVEIEAASDGQYVNLSVSDTGSGIERNELFHIFEPFFRSHSSPKNGGRGLGLAIVNEIIQLHRGKIRVQSAVGRGTTVTISIQRSIKQEEGQEMPTQENLPGEVVMDFSHRNLP